MPATTMLPSLSQVQTMDIAHLREADTYWTRTANAWEQAFSEVHERLSTPGGTLWKGQAAAAVHERSYTDLVKIRGAVYQLHEAAEIARCAAEQLQASREMVLDAVREARADGFDVGEDYSVTDRSRGGTAEFRAARLAAAQGHSNFIRHRVAALVANDQQIAAQIAAATEGIDTLTFEEGPAPDGPANDKHNGIQAVDHHTFKDAPHPEPEPPPGGWSSDPLMRAAQKIAYGHASGPDGHMDDFPGMTKDQLADMIYGKMKRSIENPADLRLGPSSSDGAPVIYDPKDNVMIIRDPSGKDCGTVFKPNLQKYPDYIHDKFGGSVKAFNPGQLADGPSPAPVDPRPAGPPAAGEPASPKPSAQAPVEAPPGRPVPSTGEGRGGCRDFPTVSGLPGIRLRQDLIPYIHRTAFIARRY